MIKPRIGWGFLLHMRIGAIASLKAAKILLTLGIGASALAIAAEPPPLEAYGDLPAVEEIAISPGGRYIASVARLQNARRLIVAEPGGTPRVNLNAGTVKVRGLEFASDDLVLLHNSATSSLGPNFTALLYEFSGTLLVPVTGGKPQLVFGRTDRVGNIVTGRYGVRQTSDGLKGYFGGIALQLTKTGPYFEHGRPTLFEVDLATNSTTKLAGPPPENGFRSWLIDENGRLAARFDISRADGTWQIRGAGDAVIATGQDPAGSVDLVSRGKDGSTVIYYARDAEGEGRYYEVPLAGGTARSIFDRDDVERLYIDSTNGRLLGYLGGSDGRTPVMFNPTHQTAMQSIFRAFRSYHATLIDWTPDFSKAIVHTSGNGDSGTYFIVDVAARKADPVGYERPAIDPEHVGPISMVEYKAADGLELDGVLTLPPGRPARNLPVLLLPHGGPHSHDVAAFDWWAQAFASRGYAVFQPNFRGSTNRDQAFRDASANEWGRKMQTDISDGLAELVKRGIVDGKRACIAGMSYGGYAALAGVTLQQGIYRCAVAVAPVSDIDLLYRTEVRESAFSPMTWRALRKDLGDPKLYSEVSPRKHAARADAPILLIHGKDDSVVPFQHSSSMAAALRNAGKPYELIELKHEDHWLSQGDTRLQTLTEAMRFVQAHNPAD